MKEKIQNITSIMMTFVFLIYFVGIEINHHICSAHGKQTATMFKNAECPCHHQENENTCHHCQDSHSNTDNSGCNSYTPHYSDECCTQFSSVFEIDDDFQYNSISNTITIYPTIENLISADKLLDISNEYYNIILNNPRDKINISDHIVEFIHKSSQSSEEDFSSIS